METFFYALPFDPRDPRSQFQQPNQPIAQDEMTRNVQCSNIMSQTTLNQAKLFTNALEEIRAALSAYSIDESDTGTSERPTLNPGFDDINRGKLQQEYLQILIMFREYCQSKKELMTSNPTHPPAHK